MSPADPEHAGGGPGARVELRTGTPLSWAEAMRPHVLELLVDQAHLEKKAAAAAVAFLFRLPEGLERHRALSALAREELVHFERALRLLAQRRAPFTPQTPCAYAERLKAAAARTMPERLVDELLVAALIEARSCERMALLAGALHGHDAELAAFYADLCEAEARHESVYVQLAVELGPPGAVPRRLGELSLHEAAVVRALPWSPRLHGGAAAGAGELGVAR
jgi:tRNA-(ms[2]io[6]A)-hydroxylase